MSQARIKEAAEVQASVPASQIRMLALSSLVPSKTNPRKNFKSEALQELAESIKAKGLLQPVLVRSLEAPFLDHFEIVAGERRYRAAMLAGLKEIPSIVRELSDQEALEVQITENLQRQDMEPLEEAEGFKALKALGYTADQIADKLKKSRSYVFGRLKLTELSEEAKKALGDGVITMSHADMIARLPNDKLRVRYAAEVLKPNWNGEIMSVKSARELLERSYTVELKGAPFNKTDKDLVPEAGACTDCPKMTGNSRELFPQGRADVCTDPVCFENKKQANILRLKRQAETEGLRILDKATQSKVFAPYSNHVQRGAGFVDLAEQCLDDPKRRSYKQLLEGSTVTPVVAFDREDNPHKLVRVEDAVKVLKEKHKIKLPTVTQNRATQPQKYDYAEEERKRKERAEYRKPALTRALARVGAYKWKCDDPTLRFLLSALLGVETRGLEGIAKLTVKHRGQDCTEQIQKVIGNAKTPLAEVVGFLMQVVVSDPLSRWADGYDYGSRKQPAADKVLSIVKADLGELASEAKKELAEKQPKVKPVAAKGKKGKPVKAAVKKPAKIAFPKPGRKTGAK